MKRDLTRAVCLLLAAVLCFLAGCSRGSEDTGAGYLFTVTLPDDPGCLDPQFTEDPEALMLLTNMTEGLMRLDADGVPVLGEAASYTVSDDGLVYTFTLRDDCYWNAKGMDTDRPTRVTARDYVFAFRRLVDPAMRSPYAEEMLALHNAKAVREGRMDPQKLGVSAPDAVTVVIELDYREPELLLLLAQTYTAPCNEGFFRETNGRYGLDEETVLCNGPFYLAQWAYDAYSSGNFLTLRKNRLYHDVENVYPSSLRYNIQHTRAQAEEDFANGTADILLTDHYPKTYLNDRRYAVQSIRGETLGLIFNIENTNLQNAALRQALAEGIDRRALVPLLTDDVEIASGVIPPSVQLLGRSYREMYADEPLADVYDPVHAAQLFDTAAAELELNTMNTMQIMVSSSIADTDALLAICHEWQQIFGYYIGIETVSPDEYDRRLAAGEYALALYAVRPTRESCLGALEAYDSDGRYLGITSEELRALTNQLRTAPDAAASVALYGDAERALLSAHRFIPLFYKNSYLVTTSGNTDIAFHAAPLSADLRPAKHF